MTKITIRLNQEISMRAEREELDRRLEDAVLRQESVSVIQGMLDRGANPISYKAHSLARAAEMEDPEAVCAMLSFLAKKEAELSEAKGAGAAAAEFKELLKDSLLIALRLAMDARSVEALTHALGWPEEEFKGQTYVGAKSEMIWALAHQNHQKADDMIKRMPSFALTCDWTHWLRLAFSSGEERSVSALIKRDEEMRGKGGGSESGFTPADMKTAFARACESAHPSVDLLPVLKVAMPILERGAALWGLSDHPLTVAAKAGQEGCAMWLLESYWKNCSTREVEKAVMAARRRDNVPLAQRIEAMHRAREESQELAEALEGAGSIAVKSTSPRM